MTPRRLPRAADARTLEAQRLFGERLSKLRKRAGLSQEALGAMVQMDGNQIYRYEKGKICPTLGTIVALADALGIKPEKLLSWPES